MKSFFKSLIVLALCIFLCQGKAYAYETNCRLVSSPIDNSVKDSFVEIIDAVLVSEESNASPIACFGVSEDGLIALGFENFEKKTVYIYSPDGVFLYGFRFTYDGSIGLTFEGQDISVYFAKSGYIATFSPEAICTSVESVPLTHENNEIIRTLLYSTEIHSNGKSYRLERDIGFRVRSFSRLVVRDVDNTEKIIYDASAHHNTVTALCFACLAGFCFLLILGFIRRSANKPNNKSANG